MKNESYFVRPVYNNIMTQKILIHIQDGIDIHILFKEKSIDGKIFIYKQYQFTSKFLKVFFFFLTINPKMAS